MCVQVKEKTFILKTKKMPRDRNVKKFFFLLRILVKKLGVYDSESIGLLYKIIAIVFEKKDRKKLVVSERKKTVFHFLFVCFTFRFKSEC